MSSTENSSESTNISNINSTRSNPQQTLIRGGIGNTSARSNQGFRIEAPISENILSGNSHVTADMATNTRLQSIPENERSLDDDLDSEPEEFSNITLVHPLAMMLNSGFRNFSQSPVRSLNEMFVDNPDWSQPPEMPPGLSSIETAPAAPTAPAVAFTPNIRNAINRGRSLENFLRFVQDLTETHLENRIMRAVMEESFREDQERRMMEQSKPLDIIVKSYQNTAKTMSECRICMSSFSEETKVCVLPCDHYFCEGCIREWGKRKNTCPFCDSEIALVKEEPEEGPAAKKQKSE
jgi:hypothetical protein